MKTEFVPLRREHLVALGQTDWLTNSGRLKGIGFTLFADDVPIAAGGISLVSKQQGYAWTMHLDKINGNRALMYRIHRFVSQQFPMVREVMRLKTIYAETAMDNPVACRWIEHFGFKRQPLARYVFEVKS